jgi:phage-related protein
VLPVIEEALRALLPVIEVLAPPVQEIVTLLGEKLAELLPELAPVLLELATLFGTILEAVTPLIEEGLNVLIEIMPELIPLIQAVADLFTALSPLIEYFAVGAKELLVPALELAIEFFTYFVIGLREIIDWVNQTIIWIVEFADGAVKNVLVPAVQIAVALLRGDWAGAWDIAKEATRDASISIFNYTWNMGEDVAGALRSMFVQVTSMFLSGFVGLRDIAARGAVWVLDKIYGLRDQTLSVVFGLAGQLYNAGANMINSLARGILSQLGSAVSAAQEVVGAIRDFFPSSPAKRGPFSGRGYPLYSGREVVNSFVRGIEERRGFLNGAMSRLLDGAPLIASSGLMADPSAAGLGGTGFSPVTGLTFARTTPNVNVFIGNERLTGYIQNVVQEDTLQQDRLASQGVRGN